MISQNRRPIAAGLVVGALVAVAVFLTGGFSEPALFILAVGVLFAGYVGRRYARDALLYRDRQNR
jgi:hypothetical protein